MILLKPNAYRSYALCQMQGVDFFTVKNFLDTQRDRLEKIEFFYPYTDEELRAVLDSGIFLGVLDKGKLIATFAIDTDDEYAMKIAEIIDSCAGKHIVERAYESSGLMVDEDYRGQGIASFLMRTAVAQAAERCIDICGVVHTLNYRSMTTFFSQAFLLSGVWRMSEGYDFVYLLKRCGDVWAQNATEPKDEVFTSLGDTRKHRELLAKGYVGVSCDSERIRFVKR